MRHTRMISMLGAATLGCAGLTTATASAVPATPAAPAVAAAAPAPAAQPSPSDQVVVLADRGADVQDVAQRLRAKGAKVTSINTAIGMVTATSSRDDLAATARALPGVHAAAHEGVVGRAPKARKERLEKPRRDGLGTQGPGRGTAGAPGQTAKQDKFAKKDKAAKPGKAKPIKPGKNRPVRPDPLDDRLWGMDMIDAPQAQAREEGDRRVKVGIIDTGVDASHPDIAPNFDRRLSRNFAADIPAIDGPCEVESCLDPATVDEGGHGTHVAGTVAAARNGIGVTGVAPGASLVNVRAGQDSGYFFVGPTVDALTYSADAGLDVVNMSFYVDPWAFTCRDGAPEDSDEAAQEQNLTLEAMTRALEYAHDNGVTLVGSAGNSALDMANPGTDDTSPDYPEGSDYPRTIDNATCFDLPVEGPHVIGVTSVGPSARKSYFSNWTTEPTSGEVEVAAPGGDRRDFYGTPAYRDPRNLILSSVPENVVRAEGSVDEAGNVTPESEGFVIKDCATIKGVERCGYYEYYQGTSMASPHASGVAALIVSAHGRPTGRGDFGLAPATVRSLLLGSAVDTACPAGGTQTYPDLGSAYDATCVGSSAQNGFYGEGIVNAERAIASAKPGHGRR